MKRENNKLTLVFLGVLYLIYKIFDLRHKIEHLNRGQSDFHVSNIGNAIANRINGLSKKVDDLKAKTPADNSEVLEKISKLSNDLDVLKNKRHISDDELSVIFSDLDELKNKPHVSGDQIGFINQQIAEIKGMINNLNYSQPQ